MSESRPHETSSLAISLEFLAILWLIPVAASALLLLLVADTPQGRLVAVAAFPAAALPRAVILACTCRTKSANRTLALLAVTLVVLLAGLVIGRLRVTAPLMSRGKVSAEFTSAPSGWLRYAPTNLLPEGDQLAFNFTVMAAVDPILGMADASRLRHMTAEIYRELENESDFSGLGSAMPDVYAELFGFRPASGHVYVYAPITRNPGQARPVLVFFHGSGGNFKAYLWELSFLADRLGFVLIAPSSGMGEWKDRQSMAALESAITAGERVAAIDPHQIHVIGLSNGGRAVSQLGASARGGIKTLTFISPVFDATAVDSVDAKLPALVVTGELDDRTPLRYVEENVREMKRRRVDVDLKTFPQADHFLMFSHRKELVETLATWLKQKTP